MGRRGAVSGISNEPRPETGKGGWNTLEDKKAGWGAPGAGAARGSPDQCMYTYIYIYKHPWPVGRPDRPTPSSSYPRTPAMPRSSRSSARPSPSSRMPSGSRSASTQAYHPPPQQHAPPPAPHQAAPPMAQPAMGGGGGGLFANMASTAAGVAVGSTVGHGISNMLFGGSGSSEPAPQPQQQQQQPQPWAQDYNAQNAAKGAACEAQSKGT